MKTEKLALKPRAAEEVFPVKPADIMQRLIEHLPYTYTYTQREEYGAPINLKLIVQKKDKGVHVLLDLLNGKKFPYNSSKFAIIHFYSDRIDYEWSNHLEFLVFPKQTQDDLKNAMRALIKELDQLLFPMVDDDVSQKQTDDPIKDDDDDDDDPDELPAVPDNLPTADRF